MVVLSNSGVRPWTIKTHFPRRQQNAKLGTKGSLQEPSRPCGRSTSGNTKQASSRRANVRFCDVQSGNRQQIGACDVVSLKVEDVAPNGYAADRATIRQKKTGQPVRFELTEQTRQAVDEYLRSAGKRPGEFMFSGRRGPASPPPTRPSCSRSSSRPLVEPQVEAA